MGRFLLVRVYTDEGIVGNGEAGLWAHHGVVKEALGELSDYYVGKDPLRIEHHYQVVSRSAHFYGRGDERGDERDRHCAVGIYSARRWVCPCISCWAASAATR